MNNRSKASGKSLLYEARALARGHHRSRPGCAGVARAAQAAVTISILL